ncbi:Spherulation-specific family 4 [Legionella wadsworthii]|uniref:Spherulation-specific family 4 n=1 Tax=Legionella wadsworthii TaxID=28088 RepID=A0A378LUI1_9GAMM|nr:spherulation-specific family 4 protein [Legionella wadsworthii]STY31287.1 Spherulation-specific family 4 [Legionella wadsworthii]
MDLKKITAIAVCLYAFNSWAIPLAADIIINPKATATPTEFSFSYAVTKKQKYYRVYIDSDHQASSGFPQGGLAAKYLIENDTLYKYEGPGWNWTKIKAIAMPPGKSKIWNLQRADILPQKQCSGTVDYLYQVESSAGISSLAKATLSYPATPECQETQKIAVPSYFYPCTGSSNCYWDQLINAAPTAGLVLINPYNGPGSTQSNDYVQQVIRAQNSAQTVQGYVYTSYGQRSLTAVKSDIDKYYSWYQVDGIFFDEGFSSDCSKLQYYQDLNSYVKSKGGKGLTTINFGTGTPECYVDASDIMINFEASYSTYLNWQPMGWEIKYPASHFWHLIYNTTEQSLSNAINLAKNRHAGWVYVTPDTLPNPWDSLPSANYWNSELSLVNQN